MSSNDSTVETLWALGALEPKKSSQTRGLGCGGKGFMRLSATYWNKPSIFTIMTVEPRTN